MKGKKKEKKIMLLTLYLYLYCDYLKKIEKKNKQKPLLRPIICICNDV